MRNTLDRLVVQSPERGRRRDSHPRELLDMPPLSLVKPSDLSLVKPSERHSC